MPPLKNLRHEQFVQLNFSDPEKNAPRAYANAGFHVKTLKDKSTSASASANRILKDIKVRARLRELQERQLRRLDVTADRVIQEMGRIAFSDVRKVVGQNGEILDTSQWDDHTAAAVAGMETEKLFEGKGKDRTFVGYTQKIKLWDKNTALGNLAKHFKLLSDDTPPGDTNMTFNFFLPINLRDPLEPSNVPSNGHTPTVIGNGHGDD